MKRSVGISAEVVQVIPGLVSGFSVQGEKALRRSHEMAVYAHHVKSIWIIICLATTSALRELLSNLSYIRVRAYDSREFSEVFQRTKGFTVILP